MTGTAQATRPPIELTALRQRAAHCRECPLGALATQTVWGEGTERARLMIVIPTSGRARSSNGSPISASRQAW